MANLFNSIRIRPPKLNRFNMSHDVKLTGKFGKLIPICCLDVLPGDVWKDNTEILVRFAPMMAPIMHRVNVYTHFFFVPKRLVWSDWKEFITGGEDGTATPVYPRLRLGTADSDFFKPGSLADYLGFPVVDSGKGIHPNNKIQLDALPFRAYQLIWNEYYRDQNLMDEIDIQKDDSGIVDNFQQKAVLMQLRNRSWQKDYFTSALPWAQRGDEVQLPLQGTADLIYSDEAEYIGTAKIDRANPVAADGSNITGDPVIRIDVNNRLGITQGSTFHNVDLIGPGVDGRNVASSAAGISKLIKGVDLSTASSATINELRRAIKAQEFLEVAARGGSRYIEQIYSYFGVRSSDARLQRPQFLGGGKSPVVVSDVLQTSQTTTGDSGSPQAQPAGHAVSVQRTHSFKFRSEEHGYIIGIMSIMPKPAYMQGLPRMFTKFDRLDHYWPQFAHLGEQEILNREIWLDASQPSLAGDTDTFGYTPRYAEYKFMTDSVHGDFRDSLLFWTMARKFSKQPGLNSEFLTNVEEPANRVFAVQDADFDKLWVNIHHNLTALRKMPKFGTPLF